MPIFNRITIIGPGLLGASLGKSLKERKICHKVMVWARREITLKKCIQEDWCDEVTLSLERSLVDAELVVICTPVNHIEEILTKILPKINAGTLVTDVGSVKKSICEVALKLSGQSNGKFIGSHPMAGSEKSGMENADSELFNGRSCIVTPLPSDSIEDVERLEDFWQLLGMKVIQASPLEHDEIVASISHLPHLLASSFAEYLSRVPENWLAQAGQGLKDTTRVAEGDPLLWCEILKSNHNHISEALALWLDRVEHLRDLMNKEKWNEVSAYLERAAGCRRKY